MAKLPYLQHDFGEKEWNAVGKLLFWRQAQKYFSVRFAQPFIEQWLYGRIHSSLQEYFLLHVSESEAAILKSAFQDFDEIDFEEVLDVMVLHDSRKLPTKITLPQMIEEMADKELIQAPVFVCDCLQSVLKIWWTFQSCTKSSFDGERALWIYCHFQKRWMSRKLTLQIILNIKFCKCHWACKKIVFHKFGRNSTLSWNQTIGRWILSKSNRWLK